MKKLITHFFFFVSIIALLTFSSCSDDDSGPKREVLINAELIQTRTASELQTFMNASPVDMDVSILKYDVEVYRVTYKTTYKDYEIEASGLVVLPKTDDEIGMMSFHHGTIAAHNDAPSLSATNSQALVLYGALGSAGFIGVIPDFIGFGESSDIFHPYYVEEVTAIAIVDNLKAARELARDKKISFNGKLFLSGYSQGGYATMATHKYIETEGLDNFNLIASFPAAGGYDVKGMQEYFFAQDTYDEPFYLAYVALAYQTYYDWTNALGDFFNEPYATRIPTLFNGINGGANINAQLTTNVSELVKADLIANIDTDPQYTFLVEAFNENSLLDWTPTVKMFMYHGDADTTVPYQNSVDTYAHFISHGASGSIVTFTALPGADHGSGIYPYLEHLVEEVIPLQ